MSSKWEVYGNNYFKLSCVFGELDGILTELPSISMSTDWQNSPAASVGEKLDEYLNNDMLQFVAAANETNNGGRMVAMDAMTSRIFKSSTPPSFELKFRIYPGQNIGPMKVSGAKEWMYLLGMATPISSDCGFSVKNFTGQLRGATEAVSRTMKKILQGEDKKDNEQEQQGQEKYQDPGMKSHQMNFDKNAAVPDDMNKDMKVLEKGFSNQEKQGGEGRADSDTHHAYGSYLFKLTIMPFIYNKPLVVYVSNWSVTPSREWNMSRQDHYFYDFTVSCHMDQVPSAGTWVAIMGNV